MDGEGTYRFANGRVYVGQWAMGHMSGFGRMEMPDGSKYEGGYETRLCRSAYDLCFHFNQEHLVQRKILLDQVS